DQICEFIKHEDDERKINSACLYAIRNADEPFLRKRPVSTFHFRYRRLEQRKRCTDVGRQRTPKIRTRLDAAKCQNFWVDECKTDALGRIAEGKSRDERFKPFALAAAGCACHEHMACVRIEEVGQNCLSINPYADRERRRALFLGARALQIAKQLHGLPV